MKRAAAIATALLSRHSGAARRAEPGIHFTTAFAARWTPGSRDARPGVTGRYLAAGLAVELVDVVPVDQAIAERLEIVGTAVAVVDVVGMLPDVAAEDRRRAVHQRALAVRGLGDFELAV